MTFKDLGIIDPILKALSDQGYTHPTPIQEKSIPILLRGKDLLACAQTGTGKTCSFAVPILQHLYEQKKHTKGPRKIKALVVSPTRELAIQIGQSFKEYGKYTGMRGTIVFGGVKQGRQVEALRRGVDVLVATPGRLLDLMGQGYINLDDVEYFVLDEADRMLDMGFIHDIRKLIKVLPQKRQSLFFSATMPPNIVQLSRKILGQQPEKVEIEPEQTTAERVDQAVYHVPKKSKMKLLIHLLEKDPVDSVLVFSRTKHGANKIVKLLDRAGIQAMAIHGNKSQGARQKALNSFKAGDTSVLVATDIAARGIDVDELGLVINYDLPNIPETYVHRIGRTGRAGASGTALSFCDVEERPYLRDIQKTIDQQIPVINTHPFADEGGSVEMDRPAAQQNGREQSKSGSGNGRNRGRRRYYSKKRS